MKKHILVTLATLMASGSALAAKSIESKTPALDDSDNCYAISTAEELYGFANLVNKASEEDAPKICGKLTNDITLNEHVLKTAEETPNVDEEGEYSGDMDNLAEWEPIGSSENPFLGYFNGKGYSISGLYINQKELDKRGLFGVVGSSEHSVSIDSVNLIDVYVNGQNQVGALVGYASSALTISGSSSKGNVKSSALYVGGLVGFASSALTISGSSSKGNVKSSAPYVGGLVGFVNGTLTITGSSSEGNVESKGTHAGGLVGYVSNTLTITGSSSEGNVESKYDYAGGLVGQASSALTITGSSSKGNVKSQLVYAGGLVGYASDTLTITGSSSEGNVESTTAPYAGGLVGYVNGEAKIEDSRSIGNVKSGYSNAGGLVGLASSALTIIGSSSEGDVESVNPYAGGLVGYVSGKTEIKNSYSKGDVKSGYSYAGGLVGYVSGDLTITGSSSEGNVESMGAPYAGGLVGQVAGEAKIENSHSKGNVKSYATDAGCLVGSASETLTITGSSSEGNVESTVAPNAGGLVGSAIGQTKIENSHSKGDVKSGATDAGGLVGYASSALTIIGSSSKGSVTSNSAYAGGLVGLASSALTIIGSSSEGDAESVNPYAGGLVGYVSGKTEIKNSYSKGDVKSEYSYAGGLVGEAHAVNIENSYSRGDVYAVGYEDTEKNVIIARAGGLLGYLNENSAMSVKNSYYAGTVSAGEGAVDFGGIAGGFYDEDPDVTLENTFYQANDGYKAYNDQDLEGASSYTLDESAAGTMAIALHKFESSDQKVNGKIWGQNLALETPEAYPTLAAEGNGKIIFPIVAELNGGSLKDGEGEGYIYGEASALPVPTREHYDFKGWYTDKDFAEGSEIAEVGKETVGTLKIYANWDNHKYTIAVLADDDAKGTVSGAGKYIYGTEVKLTAEAKTGYEFSNWNDDVKTAERTIKVTGDTTYTATFKAVESSSSEGTSSSSVESSDSESSSSTKETSSSSKNDEGKSSSSVKAKSSSSKGKIAIPVVAQLPQFSMTTVARDVQITGAKVGAPFAIFDMQGHVMTSGRVESANFSLTVSRAGTFVVRIGYETRVVNVK